MRIQLQNNFTLMKGSLYSHIDCPQGSTISSIKLEILLFSINLHVHFLNKIGKFSISVTQISTTEGVVPA
jgi:hypothetical protein